MNVFIRKIAKKIFVMLSIVTYANICLFNLITSLLCKYINFYLLFVFGDDTGRCKIRDKVS